MLRRISISSLALVSLLSSSCAQPLPEQVSDSSSSTSSEAATINVGSSTTDDTSMTTDIADTTQGASDTGMESTGAGPGCGNGIVEVGESCDDGGESASCDIDCTDVVCGDLTVNVAADEDCDGTELAGATCESLGFDTGTLVCAPGCSFDTSGCGYAPEIPTLMLAPSAVKQFSFSWTDTPGAEFYQLLESPALGEPFAQVGADTTELSLSLTVPLHFRYQASYMLRACNWAGCTDSAPVDVMGSLVEAIGYFKASNTDTYDRFGSGVALSADGNTLAVGAHQESSDANGIGGNEADDSATNAGAAYVFIRDDIGQWSQQAYIKAESSDQGDDFGWTIALSADGNTLAVSAHLEDSGATGIGGNQASNIAQASGAAYVFVRDGMGQWSQQAYVKASNTDAGDQFGRTLALSNDGNTLAVGAPFESSSSTGVDGEQGSDSAGASGAVYVFLRDGMDQWSQQAYIKASNTEAGDAFGWNIALSGDGDTLAVGAWEEDGGAAGIDGDEADNSMPDAGALYVYVRDGVGQWSQQAYVKASNPDPEDRLGRWIALDADGNTLAVGATGEDSGATGIDGDEADDSAVAAGAVYVFVRDAMDQWSQHSYVKASNTEGGDSFGYACALDDDGNVLVVAAGGEDSNATGIEGNQADNFETGSGAVYVFTLNALDQWSQTTYVKASNTDGGDAFGWSIATDGTGSTVAVGSFNESSSSTGVGGSQISDSMTGAGAVYLF